MVVPVGPGVPSRTFLILVGDAQLLQVAVEGAVLLQEAILDPAVDPQRGQALPIDPLCERIQIVGAAGRRWAEDAPHLRRDLQAFHPPPDIERCRMRDRAAEELRKLQRQLYRPEATHREATNHPPPTRPDRLEGAV